VFCARLQKHLDLVQEIFGGLTQADGSNKDRSDCDTNRFHRRVEQEIAAMSLLYRKELFYIWTSSKKNVELK
jgi:hypothetical protein